MNFALIPSILALHVFITSSQTYYAGEWIIKGVEAKVFAYILILFALAYADTKNLKKCLIFIVLASYFHFLVGFFWGIVTLAYINLKSNI